MLVLQLASDDRSRSVVGGVRPVASVCDPGLGRQSAMPGGRWWVKLDLGGRCSIRLAACDAWLRWAVCDLPGEGRPGRCPGAACDRAGRE